MYASGLSEKLIGEAIKEGEEFAISRCFKSLSTQCRKNEICRRKSLDEKSVSYVFRRLKFISEGKN